VPGTITSSASSSPPDDEPVPSPMPASDAEDAGRLDRQHQMIFWFGDSANWFRTP
jgi:hypothetical protein